MESLKPLIWIGQSKFEFGRFPRAVQEEMGFALYRAQEGKKHHSAKPLKGFGGAGVLEAITVHDRNAYRTVYTVKLAGAVYVLHAFQKKSKIGIATPKSDMELIKIRLKQAKTYHMHL